MLSPVSVQSHTPFPHPTTGVGVQVIVVSDCGNATTVPMMLHWMNWPVNANDDDVCVYPGAHVGSMSAPVHPPGLDVAV